VQILKAIAQVGTISANSDEIVGQIIAEAMDKVGKEGVYYGWRGPSTFTTKLDVVEGNAVGTGGYLFSLFQWIIKRNGNGKS